MLILTDQTKTKIFIKDQAEPTGCLILLVYLPDLYKALQLITGSSRVTILISTSSVNVWIKCLKMARHPLIGLGLIVLMQALIRKAVYIMELQNWKMKDAATE